jgi:hypothetical protein
MSPKLQKINDIGGSEGKEENENHQIASNFSHVNLISSLFLACLLTETLLISKLIFTANPPSPLQRQKSRVEQQQHK